MRQIILDTETTGLEPEQGHRIIEVGCVEVVNRRRTGRSYHQYIQPDRPVDAGAVEVHGITDAFLTDKPRFADIVAEFMAFIGDAELVIHNAAFDVGFINHELMLDKRTWPKIDQHCSIVDTLMLARQMHPGQRNSLDALCKRYGIDNSKREWHGALLDAEILADVYLAMTGGQTALLFDALAAPLSREDKNELTLPVVRVNRSSLRIIRANEDELAQHTKQLAGIAKQCGGQTLWEQLENWPSQS